MSNSAILSSTVIHATQNTVPLCIPAMTQYNSEIQIAIYWLIMTMNVRKQDRSLMHNIVAWF